MKKKKKIDNSSEVHLKNPTQSEKLLKILKINLNLTTEVFFIFNQSKLPTTN